LYFGVIHGWKVIHRRHVGYIDVLSWKWEMPQRTAQGKLIW
jgi:hypothetical protein